MVRVDNYRCHSAFVSTKPKHNITSTATTTSEPSIANGNGGSGSSSTLTLPSGDSSVTADTVPGISTAAAAYDRHTRKAKPHATTTLSLEKQYPFQSYSFPIKLLSHVTHAATTQQSENTAQAISQSLDTAVSHAIDQFKTHASNNLKFNKNKKKNRYNLMEKWSDKMKRDIAKKMSDLKAHLPHLPGHMHTHVHDTHKKKDHNGVVEISSADLPGVRFVSFFCDDNRVSCN